MSNLQTQHVLMSQSDSCVAKRNSIVVGIITLKTIWNEKVGYYFCQVSLFFWLRQEVFHTKYLGKFLSEALAPPEK